MSGCWANPNRNGGSSEARPINFFASHSDEVELKNFPDSKFDEAIRRVTGEALDEN